MAEESTGKGTPLQLRSAGRQLCSRDWNPWSPPLFTSLTPSIQMGLPPSHPSGYYVLFWEHLSSFVKYFLFVLVYLLSVSPFRLEVPQKLFVYCVTSVHPAPSPMFAIQWALDNVLNEWLSEPLRMGGISKRHWESHANKKKVYTKV